jgi:phosphoribosylformylglycinamidine synthase
LNEQVKSAIDAFIARGGLILGICNGFQALVKSGLLPYGRFDSLTNNPSPTCSITMPISTWLKWLRQELPTPIRQLTGVQVGDIHTIPVSHGEGKFVVSETELAELIVWSDYYAIC